MPHWHRGDSSPSAQVSQVEQENRDELSALTLLYQDQSELHLTLAERVIIKEAYQLAIRGDLVGARRHLDMHHLVPSSLFRALSDENMIKRIFTTDSQEPFEGVDFDHMSPLMKSVFRQQVQDFQSKLRADHHRNKGSILANDRYEAPEPRAFTPLQKLTAHYSIPKHSDLVQHRPEGTVIFYGLNGAGTKRLRLGTTPNVADTLSSVRLSGGRLLADRATWKKMGMRMLFAQSPKVAYGIVESSIFKGFFPWLPEADAEKLRDGTVAMIEVQKEEFGYSYKLFSVFDTTLFRGLLAEVEHVGARIAR
ncbi:hypothetical protein PHSY_005999 [Pseudozyma hubeiensis SY62]|uniref:Uncharacterized protein n=1 Tax=Pseudozyma hubeiensis (strain SY62) TaxID=1305764 RepID=R9PJY6_PSEHS|nr:hypothetical protein PHSY_005999 [Pseudozyma hubeiensis SY62]GAC98405.1 hypothetical protein PHSY_005999 [Pseudozyma hubeiensis SY62]